MGKVLVKLIEKVKLRNPYNEFEFLPKGIIGEVNEEEFKNQDYFFVNFQHPYPSEKIMRDVVVRVN